MLHMNSELKIITQKKTYNLSHTIKKNINLEMSSAEASAVVKMHMSRTNAAVVVFPKRESGGIPMGNSTILKTWV